MEKITKRAEDSRTIQTYIVMPEHLNAAGRLFGGRLMEWIDMTAGIVGHRHTDSLIVTAAIDHLDFKDGAKMTDVVTLIGEVTYTGRTSMEIKVDTYKENHGGKKSLINRAYLVLVCLDENLNPKEVPQLLLETEKQKREWEAAIKRNELRKIRKKEGL